MTNMADGEKSKKKWQPKRADWKSGGADEGSEDLREKRMAEVEALTVEGKARKEAEAKVCMHSVTFSPDVFKQKVSLPDVLVVMGYMGYTSTFKESECFHGSSFAFGYGSVPNWKYYVIAGLLLICIACLPDVV